MRKNITVIFILLFVSTLFAWTYVTRVDDEQPGPGELIVYINADTQYGEGVAAEARWDDGGTYVYVNTRDQGTMEYGSFLGGNANWKVTFSSGVLPNNKLIEYQVMGIGGDNNFYSYSGFNWTVDGALPVELTSFAATQSESGVELIWQTATEVNNFGFEIERKFGLGNWTNVDFIEGHGNSNSPKIYSYTDKTLISGKYLYRLKQIDIDGSYEYSSEVEINIETPSEFSLQQNYPNPFNPVTKIDFSLSNSGNVKLTVFNTIGEKVIDLLTGNFEAGNHSVEFDASHLNSGIYIYQLSSDNTIINKKMLLIK